jgi:hypothetical protein
MSGATPAAAAAGPVPGSLEGAGPDWPTDSRLFWGIYVLAWIPYAAGYLVLGFSSECTSLGAAATHGVTFALPGALLGVGPVLLTRRWDWPPERPVRFALLHLAGAVTFTVLWLLGVNVLLGLRRVLAGGTFGLAPLGGSLLRWHFVAGLLVYGALVSGTYLARTGRRLQQERERAARTEALRVRARIEALESRLSPHFLFNALHSSLSLIRRAPDRAERSIERLGDLLRYAVDGEGRAGSETVSLERELEMVDAYLEIEDLRLGDRLRLDREVGEDALEVRLPPLTVQPLVENAVQHGVAESESGGTVRLEAAVADGSLEVVVRDDGPGADPEAVESSDGVGLRLVRRRLELIYGEEASLEVDTGPGDGFRARIRIPVEEEPSSSDRMEAPPGALAGAGQEEATP